MRLFGSLVFVFAMAFSIVGCTGHIAEPVPAVGAGTQHNGLPLLPTINAAALAAAPRVVSTGFDTSRLPDANRLSRDLFQSIDGGAKAAPHRASSAGSGDNESVGVVVNSGGPYTGIVGFQSAYTPFVTPQSSTTPQLQIGYPAGATGTSVLLAPWFDPPNGSCLAPAMLYTSSGVSTAAVFVVFSLCGGGYAFAMPINDSANVQQYVTTVNGVPGFYTLTLTLDKQPKSTSTWSVLLYNFAHSRFDLVASKVGLSASTTGLALFHSQFVAGQCPVTPTLAASAMQLYNATSGKFETIVPTMTGTTSAFLPVKPADNCFNADMTGPASFNFSVLSSNSSWQVTAVPPPVTMTDFSQGITPGSQTEAITAGPDGNVWFTEPFGNRIGRISATGVVTEFSSGITSNAGLIGITAGPDGNVWFTENKTNRIGRITPSGTVTEFANGLTPSSEPARITAGPDGNLWFTENLGNRIGRITPSGIVSEYPIPTSESSSYDITAGPDGNLWFTEEHGNQIGRITTSGAIVEYAVPTVASDPFIITSGPDGNVWFVEGNPLTSQVGRIRPDGTITEFSSGITPMSTLRGIAAGPDGNLWFTESAGKIGRITPAGTVSEFSTASLGDRPYNLSDGPDGNLWFTTENQSKIGRVVP